MTPERLAEIRERSSEVTEFPDHWTRSSHPWVWRVRAIVLSDTPALLAYVDELEARLEEHAAGERLAAS